MMYSEIKNPKEKKKFLKWVKTRKGLMVTPKMVSDIIKEHFPDSLKVIPTAEGNRKVMDIIKKHAITLYGLLEDGIVMKNLKLGNWYQSSWDEHVFLTEKEDEIISLYWVETMDEE